MEFGMDFGTMHGFTDEQQLQYDSLLFDLDDTLYPLSSGIAAACRKNIEDFMVEKLGIEDGIVPDLCTNLYKNHGTTMAGLVAKGYEIDFDDYHSFVHGRLPYHVLRPDPVLRNLLLSMPQRKLVFTNADKNHALKVLSRLGLEDCFEGIMCFETIMAHSTSHVKNNIDGDSGTSVGPSPAVAEAKLSPVPVICKPSPEAMRRAINLSGVDPSKTLFFDDSSRNIAAGKVVGLHTVLVGNSTKVEGADYAIESIHNIREAIPAIWQEQDVILSGGTAQMEAIVVAA